MIMYYIYIFVLGIIMGSFYNVVGLRLLRNKSIIKPRSHCPNCKHLLKWYELIPIFSYLFLRGRCLKCRIKISPMYPIMEFLTGLFFVISFWYYGFTYMFIISIILVSLTIIVYITDIKDMVILDEVLLVSFILLSIVFLCFEGFDMYLNRIASSILLGFVMYLVKVLGDKAFKQESLGWGDIKLSLIAGLVLGIKLGLLYIFVAAILALPYALYLTMKKKTGILPFGPFLTTSMILLLWNYKFISYIISLWLGVNI